MNDRVGVRFRARATPLGCYTRDLGFSLGLELGLGLGFHYGSVYSRGYCRGYLEKLRVGTRAKGGFRVTVRADYGGLGRIMTDYDGL